MMQQNLGIPKAALATIDSQHVNHHTRAGFVARKVRQQALEGAEILSFAPAKIAIGTCMSGPWMA